MSNYHITPGYNGWTNNAKQIINAIDRREQEKRYVEHLNEQNYERNCVEMDYYEENNCFPRSTGYFGTDTDAHFYER